jgi:TDG/mug DNA glycosylase family protein
VMRHELTEMRSDDIPDDVLVFGLDIIFCGTAAGNKSASMRLPYAGPGNKFWATIYEIGLTPQRLSPSDYRRLADFGLGMTDIAKGASGADFTLSKSDFDVPMLKEKLAHYRPRILAFNGKKAASIFYKVATRQLSYGSQSTVIGAMIAWILPSTSAAARRYWDFAPWQDLGEFKTQKG